MQKPIRPLPRRARAAAIAPFTGAEGAKPMDPLTTAYCAIRSIEQSIDEYGLNKRTLGEDIVTAKQEALRLAATPHVAAVIALIGTASDAQLEEWAVRRYGPIVPQVHPAIAAEATRRGLNIPAIKTPRL